MTRAARTGQQIAQDESGTERPLPYLVTLNAIRNYAALELCAEFNKIIESSVDTK